MSGSAAMIKRMGTRAILTGGGRRVDRPWPIRPGVAGGHAAAEACTGREYRFMSGCRGRRCKQSDSVALTAASAVFDVQVKQARCTAHTKLYELFRAPGHDQRRSI